jgi:hypothetical protein
LLSFRAAARNLSSLWDSRKLKLHHYHATASLDTKLNAMVEVCRNGR